MTRDEIIKLGSQAIDDTRSAVSLPIPFAMRFAALVAAAEREAYAKACESEGVTDDERMAGQMFAHEIRARNQATKGE